MHMLSLTFLVAACISLMLRPTLAFLPSAPTYQLPQLTSASLSRPMRHRPAIAPLLRLQTAADQHEEAEELSPEEEAAIRAEELRMKNFDSAVAKYAPWMKDQLGDMQAVDQKRYAMRDGSGDKRSGDQRQQELSGAGPKAKRLGDEVELSWSTDNEEGNLGFVVERRPGGSDEFSLVASYERVQSLRSKGSSGGITLFWTRRLSQALGYTVCWIATLMVKRTHCHSA